MPGRNQQRTDYERGATAWAALEIQARGANLHPTRDGWDVELADGSWRAANDWRELCRVAHELRAR